MASSCVLGGEVDVVPGHLHGGVAEDVLDSEGVSSPSEEEEGGCVAKGVGCDIQTTFLPVGLDPA